MIRFTFTHAAYLAILLNSLLRAGFEAKGGDMGFRLIPGDSTAGASPDSVQQTDPESPMGTITASAAFQEKVLVEVETLRFIFPQTK